MMTDVISYLARVPLDVVLQLIHALEVTEDPDSCDVIRNTLEIVVSFTRDDV